MKKIIKYNDPGHGWYRVPMSLAREAQAKGVEFTGYSYQSRSGKYAYLEEDCDAARFFEVMPRESFQIVSKHTNNQSSIRNYPGLGEVS